VRPRSHSLFGHLLAWGLGTLGLLWLSLIAAGYQTGRHETAELVDGQLASVAMLLAADTRWLPITPQPREAPVNLPPQHEYQQAMSLVVWDSAGHVLAHQGTAPLPPFDAGEGFATLQLGAPAQAWRSFARWSVGKPDRRVMVLINAAERTELGWDIASQVAAPGLWLLPALALALGLALRRGLQPLQDLSDDVQALRIDQGPAQGLHSAHPAAEFRAVVQAVNTLVQRYHEALERERALASELAHELRTPLSALVLQARALREAPDTADSAALARLEHDALRAGQVLAELLALARASHTALVEAAQPVDLAALVQRVLADRAQAALAGGHDLALEGDTTWRLRGHAVLLGLAVGNLVDNALAHSAGPALVEVRLDAAAGRLLVCNGPLPGAAPASTDAATPEVGLGLGLGLGHRVVAKVAAIHGAQFTEEPPPAGFSHCYALQFLLAADGSDLQPGPADR
jgi:two-component system sensor histidine kinase QseC